MNKFILLTACITPLLLVNVNAAFQGSTESTNEVSAHKLDKYLSVKCNLPKISDDQVKNITQRSIDGIRDIQQKINSSGNITESMQKYCTEQRESVFGKAIEFAQDLVLVAKMYGDFNSVTALEKITKNAVRLYAREGDNFKAINNGSTETPEYKKNEEEFRRFIDRDLPRILDIASKYSNVSDRQNITGDNPPANIENGQFPPVNQEIAPQIEEKAIDESLSNITDFSPVPPTQPEITGKIDEFNNPSINPIEEAPFSPEEAKEHITSVDNATSEPTAEGREPFAPTVENGAPSNGETYNLMDHINEFNNPSDNPVDRPAVEKPVNPIEEAPFSPEEAKEHITSVDNATSEPTAEGREPSAPTVENGAPSNGETYNLMDHINEFNNPSDNPVDRPAVEKPVNPIEEAPFSPEEAKEHITSVDNATSEPTAEGREPFAPTVENGAPSNGETYNLMDHINEFNNPSDNPVDRPAVEKPVNPIEEAPFSPEEAKEHVTSVDNAPSEPTAEGREPFAPTVENGEKAEEVEAPVNQSVENPANIEGENLNSSEPQSEKPVKEPSVAPDKTDGSTIEGDTPSNDSMSEVSSEPKEGDSGKVSTSPEKADSSLPHSSSQASLWGF